MVKICFFRTTTCSRVPAMSNGRSSSRVRLHRDMAQGLESCKIRQVPGPDEFERAGSLRRTHTAAPAPGVLGFTHSLGRPPGWSFALLSCEAFKDLDAAGTATAWYMPFCWPLGLLQLHAASCNRLVGSIFLCWCLGLFCPLFCPLPSPPQRTRLPPPILRTLLTQP
jgi:hypothetical protein